MKNTFLSCYKTSVITTMSANWCSAGDLGLGISRHGEIVSNGMLGTLVGVMEQVLVTSQGLVKGNIKEKQEGKRKAPVRHTQSHGEQKKIVGENFTTRTVSATDLHHTKTELKSLKTRKPCVLRQKSAPSRSGSRRYLTRQRTTTSTSDEYLLDIGTPEMSQSSDIWTVSPSRPRQTLDLTAKQHHRAPTSPSFHTLCSLIICGVFVVAVVGLILFLNLI